VNIKLFFVVLFLMLIVSFTEIKNVSGQVEGLECPECEKQKLPVDSDGDGISDNKDNCPMKKNSEQLDSDADDVGDICDDFPSDPDNDIDGDKVSGIRDNCKQDYNPNQEDSDGDMIGDICDDFPSDPNNDIDKDGVSGVTDNCKQDYNPNQEDSDGDMIGDICDSTPFSVISLDISPRFATMEAGNFFQTSFKVKMSGMVQQIILLSCDLEPVGMRVLENSEKITCSVDPTRFVLNENYLSKTITLKITSEQNTVPDTYPYELIAKSNIGNDIIPVPFSLTIKAISPTVTIIAPNDQDVDTEIVFEANLNDPSNKIKKLEWDFGDESPKQIGTVVTHIYKSENINRDKTFTIRLTSYSQDPNGKYDELGMVSHDIKITKPDFFDPTMISLIGVVGSIAIGLVTLFITKRKSKSTSSKFEEENTAKNMSQGNFSSTEKIIEKDTETILKALSIKLEKIFETNEKFLTFPKGLGFSHKELDFMKDISESNLTPKQKLDYQGQFSRLLNIIPEDRNVWSPDASRFLWDELINTLKNAVFAKSSLTPKELKQLDEAINFLQDEKVENEQKIPIYSLQLSKYYEYKELFLNAHRTYLDEKITVENSIGPESEKLRKNWTDFRQNQLIETKNKAEQDWKNLGYKEKVEYCQSLRESLEPKKYLGMYRNAYLNELKTSELTDLNGVSFGFFATFFSPSDAFDTEASWNQLTMTKKEIEILTKQGTGILGDFKSNLENVDFESISMNYKEIAIIRPWFKQEFFTSRNWKLRNESIISDGKIPRKGRIPSFITSMIVVKNVKIHRKKTQNRFSLNSLLNRSNWKKTFSTMPIDKIVPKTPVKKIDVGNKVGSLLGSTSFFNDKERKNAQSRNLNLDSMSHLDPELARQYIEVKYKGTTIKTPISDLPIKSEELSKKFISSQDLITDSFEFDDLKILAFICKRMPKSPNPDEKLNW